MCQSFVFGDLSGTIWKQLCFDKNNDVRVMYGGQMADWLGSRAINQKVVGTISGCTK